MGVSSPREGWQINKHHCLPKSALPEKGRCSTTYCTTCPPPPSSSADADADWRAPGKIESNKITEKVSFAITMEEWSCSNMLGTLPVLLLWTWFIPPRVSIPESDGKGSSHGQLEVYHDVLQGMRSEDIHQGRQKGSWGVDFTDVTLVYKDANQHKAHKIILSWPEAYWWRTAKILASHMCVEDQLLGIVFWYNLKKKIQKKNMWYWYRCRSVRWLVSHRLF